MTLFEEYQDDDYGDWLYECEKDRRMFHDDECAQELKNLQLLYNNAIKAHAFFNALRHADQMAAVANRMYDKRYWLPLARELQERADKGARAWA